MSKWGLKRTAALRRLTISGKIGCLVGTNSFPPPPDHEEEEEDEGPGQDKGGWHVLPPSLLYLLVLNQENLVTISSGMQSHLTSLLCLSIQGSPKLKLLPREGLPASLLILYIEGCTEDLLWGLAGGHYNPCGASPKATTAPVGSSATSIEEMVAAGEAPIAGHPISSSIKNAN
ncbi:hypothetical protein CRG98_040459 [Punica granatum]|uniref:Uncharacterized protein n=1 Tax=Punica granatum TaxID=22663 RepID=A0A2I0I5A9_PUNGR|nr:hypothetical protein CRG98_040459 [Punica granatum]